MSDVPSITKAAPGSSSLTAGGFYEIGSPAINFLDGYNPVDSLANYDYSGNLIEQAVANAGAQPLTNPSGGVDGYYAYNVRQEPSTAQSPTSTPSTASAVGAVGAGAQIVTSLANAASTYFQSKAAKKIAKAQERVQNANARINELMAEQTLRQSNWRIGQITQRAGMIKASQKTQLAANGVKLGKGSAAEIIASTDLMKEIDINQQYVNGYRDAWSIRIRGTQSRMAAIASSSYASSVSPIGNAITVGANGLLQTYKDYRKEFESA